MRTFRCEVCGAVVAFDAQLCGICGTLQGYVPERRAVSALRPDPSRPSFTVDGGAPLWRCLNAAWGCNWTLPAGTGNTWCRSCRLTRGRPDESQPDAVEAWATVEASKRRLIYQLDTLALPIEGRSAGSPHGLAFDLVYLPGEAALTGHLDGIITLDLCETDEQHRDALRRRLDEPFRTLIGHLRHEIGHHYWDYLVPPGEPLDAFRQLFGDERADYRVALADHYLTGGDWNPARHITPYAGAHPLEDWAETFAHYLHIADATTTAIAHHLTVGPPVTTIDTDGAPIDGTFADLLARWRPIADALNAVASSLGVAAVYPIEVSGLVEDKLSFVHDRVTCQRDGQRT